MIVQTHVPAMNTGWRRVKGAELHPFIRANSECGLFSHEIVDALLALPSKVAIGGLVAVEALVSTTV